MDFLEQHELIICEREQNSNDQQFCRFVEATTQTKALKKREFPSNNDT